ncbi:Methyltransferase-like protein 22 [Rhizophlyctis rosea]|uniref:Methyltransferase-like protein 22 n=1 Tax=Rhizophlyctis rosea TaxID=64517 RepID=A0AAD5SKG1_9FUNG|nr:Methyltransferase-like protein 22 [Rhizophlyctis rosea]
MTHNEPTSSALSDDEPFLTDNHLPDEDDFVLSEVHMVPSNLSPYTQTTTITPFHFPNHNLSINIHHRLATPLDLVGQQVWNGALLMIDFILSHTDLFRDKVVCEIGAGTGIVSVVCGKKEVGCLKVFGTDLDDRGILELCRLNVKDSGVVDVVEVYPVDLLDDNCPIFIADQLPSDEARGWPFEAVEEFHTSCSVLLACDVIYDEPITFAFVRRMPALLTAGRILFLSLEKRIVFTTSQMETRAPAVDYLFETIEAFNADRDELGLAEVKWERVRFEGDTTRGALVELWKFWL